MITERDVEVPMRDGVALVADVYRPDSEAPAPAVLNRTCYDRSFSMTPAAGLDPEVAVEAGFAVVVQDVRGQYGSPGDFYPFRSERADGYDSVEWCAVQPWCNGDVFTAGRSYAGANQWLTAAEQPPALRGIAPFVCGCSLYDGWIYQGGAFQYGFNLFWVQMMSGARVKGSMAEQYRHLPISSPPVLQHSPAADFYRDWLAHPTDDDYWREFAIVHDRVEVPALIVGGWYDLFLAGTLENWAAVAGWPGTRLLIGPWAHGSTYGAYPDHAFDPFEGKDKLDLAQLQLDFYREARSAKRNPATPVQIFTMGVNEWRSITAWPPPAEQQRWFLRAGGVLSRSGPGSDEPADEFVYDPGDPAPTIGGPTSLPAPFMRTNSGPMDQSRLEERADVLVFSSEPLEAPLEVTGPLRLTLHAATSATDTDFVAKLCDVDPDGYSRILAEGVLRARYREGFERAVAIEPERVYDYEIDLVATSNVFLPGHRIRVMITSSSFPRFDRNLGTGEILGTEMVTARQTVFHDGTRPSFVMLPVVTAARPHSDKSRIAGGQGSS